MTSQLFSLLFVDERLSEIEQIVRSLRQSGYVIRKISTTTLVDIEHHTSKVPADLVLYNVDSSTPPFHSVRAKLSETQGEAAIIGLSHKTDPPDRLEFLKAGMRDAVSSANLDLVTLVCKRELTDMVTRRRAREMETLVLESDQRCRHLLDSSREAIAYIHDGAHVTVNPSYLELFGYRSKDELEGLPIMDMVQKTDRNELRAILRRFARGDRGVKGITLTGLRVSGETFPVDLRMQSASVDGEPCVQVMFRDATPTEDMAAQLDELRKRDVLTGLYNRQHLKQILDEMHVRVRDGEPGGALICLLLDHLREICEKYDLTTGDQLLRDVAGMLRCHFGPDDILVHYSDPLFMVITEGRTVGEVEVLAETLRKAVDEHVLQANSRMITTTCCVGITMIDGQQADASEVIAQADGACDEARKLGGNRIVLFTQKTNVTAGAKPEEVEAAIKTAIDSDLLTFLFQPIASLTGNPGERFQLTPVLRDRDGRLRPVAETFPGADDYQLLGHIDRACLGRAVALIRQLKERGGSASLFLPISADGIADTGLLQWLDRHLPPNHGLVIELAESLAERYYRQTQELCQLLRSRGSMLALTDIGTGDNTERLVDLLQPSFIKFGEHVVDALGNDDTISAYVDALTEKVRAFGGEAIVDRVATARQLASLWQTNVALIQGDFVAPPHESMSFDFEQFVA